MVPDGDPSGVFCPASGITDELRGSPWDPRVAWGGLNRVRWPAGWTARFTPALELVAPSGRAYRPGDTLQVAGTVGAEPVFVACGVTGGT